MWTVTQLESRGVFAWEAKVLTVTMVAVHHLKPVPEGCRNPLTVELTGFGSRLVARLLGATLRTAIETENRGFRSAAEGDS